uniref:Uncharacterized protein n=1 Tax=Lotharella globosa TaxID=91324 RepID=A0A7S3YL68_9EUKA
MSTYYLETGAEIGSWDNIKGKVMAVIDVTISYKIVSGKRCKKRYIIISSSNDGQGTAYMSEITVATHWGMGRLKTFSLDSPITAMCEYPDEPGMVLFGTQNGFVCKSFTGSEDAFRRITDTRYAHQSLRTDAVTALAIVPNNGCILIGQKSGLLTVRSYDAKERLDYKIHSIPPLPIVGFLNHGARVTAIHQSGNEFKALHFVFLRDKQLFQCTDNSEDCCRCGEFLLDDGNAILRVAAGATPSNVNFAYETLPDLMEEALQKPRECYMFEKSPKNKEKRGPGGDEKMQVEPASSSVGIDAPARLYLFTPEGLYQAWVEIPVSPFDSDRLLNDFKKEFDDLMTTIEVEMESLQMIYDFQTRIDRTIASLDMQTKDKDNAMDIAKLAAQTSIMAHILEIFLWFRDNKLCDKYGNIKDQGILQRLWRARSDGARRGFLKSNREFADILRRQEHEGKEDSKSSRIRVISNFGEEPVPVHPNNTAAEIQAEYHRITGLPADQLRLQFEHHWLELTDVAGRIGLEHGKKVQLFIDWLLVDQITPSWLREGTTYPYKFATLKVAVKNRWAAVQREASETLSDKSLIDAFGFRSLMEDDKRDLNNLCYYMLNEKRLGERLAADFAKEYDVEDEHTLAAFFEIDDMMRFLAQDDEKKYMEEEGEEDGINDLFKSITFGLTCSANPSTAHVLHCFRALNYINSYGKDKGKLGAHAAHLLRIIEHDQRGAWSWHDHALAVSCLSASGTPQETLEYIRKTCPLEKEHHESGQGQISATWDKAGSSLDMMLLTEVVEKNPYKFGKEQCWDEIASVVEKQGKLTGAECRKRVWYLVKNAPEAKADDGPEIKKWRKDAAQINNAIEASDKQKEELHRTLIKYLFKALDGRGATHRLIKLVLGPIEQEELEKSLPKDTLLLHYLQRGEVEKARKIRDDGVGVVGQNDAKGKRPGRGRSTVERLLEAYEATYPIDAM